MTKDLAQCKCCGAPPEEGSEYCHDCKCMGIAFEDVMSKVGPQPGTVTPKVSLSVDTGIKTTWSCEVCGKETDRSRAFYAYQNSLIMMRDLPIENPEEHFKAGFRAAIKEALDYLEKLLEE